MRQRIRSSRYGPTQMVLAFEAIYVTFNIDAEEVSEIYRQGMRLLRWKEFDSRRRRGTAWKYD